MVSTRLGARWMKREPREKNEYVYREVQSEARGTISAFTGMGGSRRLHCHRSAREFGCCGCDSPLAANETPVDGSGRLLVGGREDRPTRADVLSRSTQARLTAVHDGVSMGVGNWPLLDFIMISYLYEDTMADGVGFEPTVRLHVRRFSRPLPSTARPPIRRAST
jgi:hypothetical protein